MAKPGKRVSSNPCAKKRQIGDAYEVWEDTTHSLIYYVLKKYQAPEHERGNPYARWFVATIRPGQSLSQAEYGDVYVKTVTNWCKRVR